ncbi:MAG TPA: DUF4199 domain-containing protein [Ferruginibacter sp.]|nr:DUF4199 domain-containing protein [Ferruginibacter sp.]HRO05518.1 DUF4199 domain-containing protein [Ferruginibacter sp.]HRO96268.1 DUF4199 domain-containing protein [Ferruginibacter sp.]HRP49438.1 DUF4199 domain-containing protein [Ferruginibacter sp.]
MMINLNPTLKGLITGVLMIVVSIYIYSTYGNFENNMQYITYALYVGGLIWTLISYHQQEVLKTFKTYFSQGFKYFIVVTMLMVLFTIVFMNMNPSIKEEMAQNYRAQLMQEGNKTPAEIENLVLQMKEYYSTMITSMAIFFYLLVGTAVTVITSFFLLLTNKKRARH